MAKTAEDYRADAAASLKAKEDSFDRCDTDGFVSQHCHELSSRLSRRLAEITEAGKTAEFIGLYEGDRRVRAKEITTRFGTSWLLDEEAETDLVARRGKVFLPTGENSRILKNLGLAERRETAPAWACYHGEGTGFSGLASVGIKTFRTGCKWGSDATLAPSELPE